MKGKVFESSRDVYQDQARVLFDFYLNAAQKIVDQEDDFDNKVVLMVLLMKVLIM